MQKLNYIYDCLNGDALWTDIDDYVEYWHSHDTGCTLKAFLGMTDYEYEQWIKNSDNILKDIFYCREYELNLHEYLSQSRKD